MHHEPSMHLEVPMPLLKSVHDEAKVKLQSGLGQDILTLQEKNNFLPAPYRQYVLPPILPMARHEQSPDFGLPFILLSLGWLN